MNFQAVKPLIANIASLAMFISAGALLFHSIHGPFDYSLLGARAYMDDGLKTFQIFIAALILRTLIFLAPAETHPAETPERARLGAVRRGDGAFRLLAAIIFIFAMALRAWPAPEGFIEAELRDNPWPLAPAVTAFLSGDYLFDHGYPHFSAHMIEWTLRLYLLAGGFDGANPAGLDPQSPLIAALGLNLAYSGILLYCVWRLGKLVGGSGSALAAAFLAGVSLAGISAAHNPGPEALMALTSLAGVYFAALNLREERRLYYLASGLLIGLSCSAKLEGAISLVYVGFIYIQSRGEKRDIRPDWAMPASALAAFALAYLFANPLALADPWAKFDYTMAHIYAITPWEFMDRSVLQESYLQSLMRALDRLFAPLPWQAGALAIGFAGYRLGWSAAFLWLSPLPCLLIAAIIPQEGGVTQTLNISILSLLAASLGLWEACLSLRRRWAGGILLLALALYCAHGGLQHASYRSIPSSAGIHRNWLEENLAAAGEARIRAGGASSEKPDPGKISEVYLASGEWLRSPFRGVRRFASLREGGGALFPMAHFPSQRREAVIFPASFDLAATDRAFALGTEANLFSATRYVVAEETDGHILVWVKNPAPVEAQARLRIGRLSFNRRLKPGEFALFEANAEQSRGFLREGRYVKVIASSKGDTVWVLAARHDQAGDLLMEAGRMDEALEKYRRSGSAYALLRLMALGGAPEDRARAGAQLKAGYPSLFRTMTELAPEEWTFKNLAGYDDRLFAGKMTRSYGYGDFHLKNIPSAGLTLPNQDAGIWGPYAPLMRGDYVLDLKWLIHGEEPESFRVEIATRRYPDNGTARVYPGREAREGNTAIRFTEDNAVSYPFEIIIGESAGGALGLMEAALTIDYMGPLRRLVLEAGEGAGAPYPRRARPGGG